MSVRANHIIEHIQRLASRPSADLGTDADLLARFFQHQDEQAFAALVSLHTSMALW